MHAKSREIPAQSTALLRVGFVLNRLLMRMLGVLGSVFSNSRLISPPLSGSFGIILVGEVSREAAKSTKEGEDGQGRRLPPPLKLWRTGKAVRRR
jgi:hypothetical protein